NEVRVVRIINNQETDITLSEPEVNNRSFQLELKTIRPGKEFELQVKVVPPVAPGTVSASATVKTSVTNMPSIAVSVVAMVQPPLMAMPAQLTLPAGPLVSGTRMGVTFRNNGAGTVTISEPTVNVAGVEARLQEIQPGRVFNVVLSFPTGFDVPAGQQAELVVKTTNPQYPTMKVPIAMMPRTGPVPAMPPPATPPVMPNRIQPAPMMPAVPATSPPLPPRPATPRLPPPIPPLPNSPTNPAQK
ncbi:MAG: hypothetical protein NTW03_17460, partial [Verrucomicrobia bacterium]|nr:hypothetical protein [Verrucomicrobiota bacterium]